MKNKTIIIETPKSDNKIKHNLITNIRELLNIYTSLSVQNIGFIAGINKQDKTEFCYVINIIDCQDLDLFYSELNKLKDVYLWSKTEENIYYKLK